MTKSDASHPRPPRDGGVAASLGESTERAHRPKSSPTVSDLPQSCALFVRLAFAVVTTAPALGWIDQARAGESIKSPAPPPPIRATARPEIRAAMREFDRFLDHHPVVEDKLRLDPKLAADNAFLELNPELHNFLGTNPKITEGLKLYPRYYLNRALLRQASVPLPFRELARLRELFRQDPKLERSLTENPEAIRDQVFLNSHPPLRICLAQHPALASAFLPQPVPPQTK